MALLSKVRSVLGRGSSSPKIEQSGILITSPSIPVRPIIPPLELKKIWDNDESFSLATQFVAEAVAGPGHHITVEPSSPDLLRDLRQFEEDVGMDELLFGVAEELVGWGYSFTEIVKPSNIVNLVPLPVYSNWELGYDKLGQTLLEVRQRLGSQEVKFKPDQLIFWQYRPRGELLGRGILHLAASERNYSLRFSDDSVKKFVVPSLYERKAMVEDDMRLVFHHLIPRSFITIEGADDAFISAEKTNIAKMSPGERYVLNLPVKVVGETVDPRARFDAIVDFLDTAIVRATGVPILKLFTQKGFTEASARVVVEQFDRKVASIQRIIARKVERHVYQPLAAQLLGDRSVGGKLKFDIRLKWNQLGKPTPNEQNIIAFVSNRLMTLEEARNTLRTWGYMLGGELPKELTQPIAEAHELDKQIKDEKLKALTEIRDKIRGET